MRTIETNETVIIPENVKVTAKSRVVRVVGKRGFLKRDFKHLSVEIKITDNKLEVVKYHGNKKDRASVRTLASHIQNMIKGVTVGFQKKMKAVYAHFPINMVVSSNNDSLTIRNFLGERLERKVDMLKGVTISPTSVKDEICVIGNDIELVSKCAAQIQQKCVVKNKDIRKFLDGIYVSEVLAA